METSKYFHQTALPLTFLSKLTGSRQRVEISSAIFLIICQDGKSYLRYQAENWNFIKRLSRLLSVGGADKEKTNTVQQLSSLLQQQITWVRFLVQ